MEQGTAAAKKSQSRENRDLDRGRAPPTPPSGVPVASAIQRQQQGWEAGTTAAHDGWAGALRRKRFENATKACRGLQPRPCEPNGGSSRSPPGRVAQWKLQSPLWAR